MPEGNRIHHMAHQQTVAALMIPGLPYLHLPAMLMAMTVVNNNDFGDSVVIMGQIDSMGRFCRRMRTGADVTENDGKTGSIEAYTETAAEKVNVKDGNTESGEYREQ